jgi:hypothetical protein
MATLGISVLGLCFGAVVALAILVANLVAARFARGSSLLDIVIRLGTFGALILVSAEVVGFVFGAEVRQNAPWFWGAFAIGFVVVPSAFAIRSRRRSQR